MQKRFFRAATISIVAGLIIAFLFAIPLMEQLYTKEMAQRLDTALSLAQGFSTDGDYAHLAQQVGEKLKEMRFTVIAADGRVLGDSDFAIEHMENHGARAEVREALAAGEGTATRNSPTDGGRQIYLAQRVTLADNTMGVYRVSLSVGGFGELQTTLWVCAVIGIFMGLIVALFSANYAAGRMVEPLQALTRAARSAAGDTPVHVEDAPDEIGELSAAFNLMSERLALAYQKLAHSNEQLESILHGMDDGVVAISADGSVALMTGRAQELLDVHTGLLHRLEDGGAHCAMVQTLLEKVMHDSTPVKEILDTGERILHIYAAHTNAGDGGALAVVSDVTRIRKLEIMRSEFVANVTHELKTPLTSIRGYIELLKSGHRDEKTAQSFYEIIEIEAERLHKLTDDLLQLSDIENGEDREVSPVAVAETVEGVCTLLSPEAQERQVTLHVCLEPDLQVSVSAHHLYILLKNLMENAIKYNQPGGAVHLCVKKQGEKIVIQVQDTGIGIPSAHLERIFERFYRVDKGRSREQGGTGLGLSIVKHVVNLYGGEMHVESVQGVGTTFTVILE